MGPFEWDPIKAELNFLKHGVTFEEASTAFSDVASFVIDDLEHSAEEDRFVLLGRSYLKRVLIVAHTYREGSIRLIHARVAEPRYQRTYERGPE